MNTASKYSNSRHEQLYRADLARKEHAYMVAVLLVTAAQKAAARAACYALLVVMALLVMLAPQIAEWAAFLR